MSHSSWPSGLITAMVTPLTDDGINEPATRELVERQVRGGASGVVVAGGTGEHGALSLEERAELARIVVDAADGRISVVVQSGALTTHDAVRISRDAQELGASGLLVPAPFGEAVNWREKQAYYEDVNAAVDLPIMLYNTPAAGLMTLEQVRTLGELSNVSAIKNSSESATLLVDLVEWARESNFAVYTGWDDLTAPAILAGARGALLGAGNVAPELIVQVIGLCQRHELGPEFQEAWGRLRRFLRFIGNSENYVSVVKLATSMGGVDVGDVRRPYLMPDETERAALVEELRKLNGALVGS
jgi:4-hydroxy-tetrahydrodipicolinate synthase